MQVRVSFEVIPFFKCELPLFNLKAEEQIGCKRYYMNSEESEDRCLIIQGISVLFRFTE